MISSPNSEELAGLGRSRIKGESDIFTDFISFYILLASCVFSLNENLCMFPLYGKDMSVQL